MIDDATRIRLLNEIRERCHLLTTGQLPTDEPVWANGLHTFAMTGSFGSMDFTFIERPRHEHSPILQTEWMDQPVYSCGSAYLRVIQGGKSPR